MQLEITYTQRAYVQEELDTTLFGRIPAPEEDLFHPNHAAYKLALEARTKSRL